MPEEGQGRIGHGGFSALGQEFPCVLEAAQDAVSETQTREGQDEQSRA